MPSKRLQKIETLFQTATDLSVNERAEYLAEHCAEDTEMRREVEILLTRFDTKNSAAENELNSMEGKIVGSYRILREIGRGGMGAVYSAERADGIFRTKAAVKLIKRGMDTDSILRRFRNERQILAALNHSNVARLLDGGSTEEGLPYFVMEYVDGKPLFRFCEENNSDIKARLEIFRQICDAVEQAHNIKVVHRDLKPSNILVKADGTPKLLDFGIAKLLDPELASATLELTITQWRLMTPQYASPEQIGGGEITFASDVYSLGVVLYELVTGAKPYHFKSHAPHEISRVVCEQAAAPITNSGLRIADLNLENLNKIVLKALRKIPSERYQSASELRADIESLLNNLPVSAESFVSVRERINPKGENKHSIAILPFKLINLSHSEDTGGDVYLSLGLADALVSRLSAIRRLLVRPTSSVMRFGGESDAFAAGHQLGVDFIVEGNIRRVGERIRITTQLFDVKANSTRWADKFDEHFTDVLELEDTISERVVRSLLPQLTGEEREKLDKRGTNSPEAYESHLRGRFYWNQFTPESLLKAKAAFENAVRLDSDYALAYVDLADFYIWGTIYGLIPSLDALGAAEKLLLRAVEIDGALGEAYASLGLINQNRKRWNEAKKLKNKALELSPHYVHAHEWAAAQAIGLGENEEGIREILITEKLDPLSLRTKTLVGWTLYQAHHFEETIERGRQIIDLDKNYPQGYSQIGLGLYGLGKFDEALPNFQKFDEMIPGSALAKYQLCFGLVKTNRVDEAAKVLQDINALANNDYVKPFFLAMANAALGNLDKAFTFFERSSDEDEPWMLWFGTEPMLENLHSDARFLRLLEKMNNPLAETFRKNSAVTSSETTDAKQSVAVLPLILVGAKTTAETDDDDYLRLGLADAIIIKLSNVRRLVVRPTSSVLRFNNEPPDPFEAGRELNVEAIVEGTIRRIGERIRVSVRLLSVRNNSIIWAERFDEKFTDVLEIEDSISERIAHSLIPELTGEERQQLQKRGTNSPAAYEAFMRGRYLANQFTNDSLLKSLAAFEEAIRIDPDYALPRVGVAEFYVWSSVFGALSSHDAYPKAKAELSRALAIDDQLGEAYSLSAFVALLYDWDWKKAENLVKEALAINPNYSFAHNAYAHIFASQGMVEPAMREIKRAESLDPLSPLAKVMTSCISYQVHRFSESTKSARRASEMQMNFPQGFLHLGNSLTHDNGAAEAIEVLTTLCGLWENSALPKFMLCFALAGNGLIADAKNVLRQSLKISETNFVKPYFIAMAYVAVGDIENAFEYFSKAVETRDEWMIWFGTDIKLDILRNDPRYFEILEKTNNPIILNQRKNIEN